MINYEFKKGSATAVNIRSTYGVNVEASRGLIGKPNMKSVDSFDWKYLHGSTPDLANRRYENKTITLDCWMTAKSKQQLVENVSSFLAFFSYDELLWMKVSWTDRDGHPSTTPDPYAAKGIYGLVYLKSVSEINYKYRFGQQLAKFSLTFVDPYPMKRVVKYGGTSGSGVDYNIISETEIDLYLEDGTKVMDILSQSGHIDCGLNTMILICGDVVHASTENQSNQLIVPTDSVEDTVTTIYDEI